MKRQAGFTLMELLVAVAIIGIISAIAYPSYQNQMMQSRRADARVSLFAMAAQQELFYAGPALAYTAVVANVGGAASRETFYTLSAVVVPGGGGYTLTAVPAAGGPQTADVACLSMTLNQAGLKLPAVCW